MICKHCKREIYRQGKMGYFHSHSDYFECDVTHAEPTINLPYVDAAVVIAEMEARENARRSVRVNTGPSSRELAKLEQLAEADATWVEL